jgi:hypothetical protein
MVLFSKRARFQHSCHAYDASNAHMLERRYLWAQKQASRASGIIAGGTTHGDHFRRYTRQASFSQLIPADMLQVGKVNTNHSVRA